MIILSDTFNVIFIIVLFLVIAFFLVKEIYNSFFKENIKNVKLSIMNDKSRCEIVRRSLNDYTFVLIDKNNNVIFESAQYKSAAGLNKKILDILNNVDDIEYYKYSTEDNNEFAVVKLNNSYIGKTIISNNVDEYIELFKNSKNIKVEKDINKLDDYNKINIDYKVKHIFKYEMIESNDSYYNSIGCLRTINVSKKELKNVTKAFEESIEKNNAFIEKNNGYRAFFKDEIYGIIGYSDKFKSLEELNSKIKEVLER